MAAFPTLPASDALLAGARPFATSRTAASLLAGLVAAVLAGLALYSLFYGFDASLLMTGDALYPVQMLDGSLLQYRPPLANRIFPDVATHAVLRTFVADPFTQKLVAGIALFLISAAVIGFYKGFSVFCLWMALTLSHGFGFFDSACHYSLPVTIVLFQIARPHRVLSSLVLATIVFSDLLVLIPLAVLLLDPAERERLAEHAVVAAAAAALAIVYAEFDATVLKFTVALAAWYWVVYAATRLNLRLLLSIGVIAGLILAAATGLIYPRYTLPIAAALLMAITPVSRGPFRIAHLATAAAVVVLFLSTLDTGRLKSALADYDCVAELLPARAISTIATDHWTAKPLYFATRRRGHNLTITQTDFAEGDSLLWMASYDFYGAPTPWALKDVYNCDRIGNPGDHCGQETTAPILSRENVCGRFVLFRYSVDVPSGFEPAPASKTEAVTRRLKSYAAKAEALVRRKLGSLVSSSPG
jgi:hypothetical protein